MKFDDITKLTDVRELIGKKVARILPLDRSAINEDSRTVKIAFSSETPVERYFGIEVLDHSRENVNTERVPGGMAFLLNHDTDRQIGVVEDVKIDDDRVGRAVVRISKNAEDIWTDLKDGIRRNISVGYMIDREIAKETREDGRDIIRFAWTPLELSLVAVPADVTVGVGRSLDSEVAPPEGDAPQGSEQAPPEGEPQEAPAPVPEQAPDATPPPAPEPEVPVAETKEEEVPPTPQVEEKTTPVVKQRKTDAYFGDHFPKDGFSRE